MRSRKSPLEYYRTLGLQPGASKKELRTAYLRLVKECHPDRFARNPEAQSHAQEKLKAVNEAYAYLRHYQPDGVYEVWTYPRVRLHNGTNIGAVPAMNLQSLIHMKETTSTGRLADRVKGSSLRGFLWL